MSVVDNAFEPPRLQTTPGDTVTWTWEGGSDHNAVGDGFASEIQRTGTYERVDAAPGHRPGPRCEIHWSMIH